MKTPHVVAALVAALFLAPVVLSVGTFILFPVILLLISALPVLSVAALAALVVSAARGKEPVAARAQPPSTVAYPW